MMHLELSLRNRHYMDALQISIKLFKDDEKTFELVANVIKELGGIPPICNECPEVKVWNYFFDALSQQYVPDDFPLGARPRVATKKRMKEDLMIELREQVGKNKPMEEFIKRLSKKVAVTKVKMTTSRGDKSESARIADMAAVFEYT